MGRSEGVVSEETVGSNQTEELTYRVFSQGKPGFRSTRIAKLCSNAVPDRHRDSVQWLRLRVCVLGGGGVKGRAREYTSLSHLALFPWEILAVSLRKASSDRVALPSLLGNS